MHGSGWFERRLLLALALFSLIPSLALIGAGTWLLSEAVSLPANPAAWEQLAESGRALLERAEASADDELREAAARHREQLSRSMQQAQRWGFLSRRVLEVIPWFALGLVALLGTLAVRSARGIARELARPIRELVGWSERIARDEALPSATPDDPAEAGEFGVLRNSFRVMAHELDASRARAVAAERIRASVSLARGISHELKNSLTPLRLAIRMLQRQADRSPSDLEALAVIDAESTRLDELARAFARFGQPQEGPRSEVDLPELLGYLVRTHLPDSVEVRLTAPPDLPRISGIHDPLSRAFANLILNASEAMEGSGTLAVDLASRNGFVRVSVRDSGPGLPPGAESRIWDPDFTRKPRGTGLGLALARQAIHAHGGTIAARTHPDGGAEFTVTLPTGPDARPSTTGEATSASR